MRAHGQIAARRHRRRHGQAQPKSPSLLNQQRQQHKQQQRGQHQPKNLGGERGNLAGGGAFHMQPNKRQQRSQRQRSQQGGQAAVALTQLGNGDNQQRGNQNFEGVIDHGAACPVGGVSDDGGAG